MESGSNDEPPWDLRAHFCMTAIVTIVIIMAVYILPNLP